MISQKLSYIAEKLSGELIGSDLSVDKVFTDSRTIENNGKTSGRLFVALKGPQFDAHHFIQDVAKIVSAVVVDRVCDISIPQIVVVNTRKALGEIARINRNASHAKVVAITGSCGKTTVKEMIASVLSKLGKTHATKGNLNNDIGAPLTLLEMSENTEFSVIELGANHEGEIAYTSDITKPIVAMVNNVSEAHLQGFGDIQGVARAKSEIYFSLAKNGTAVLNADDQFYDYFKSRITCQQLSFSVEKTNDVYATNIIRNVDQSISFDLNYKNQTQQINLPLVGLHNVSNALAAAACCLALGVTIKQVASGLQQTPLVPGRLVVNKLSNGLTLIDDSYNANVSSMNAAIDLLSHYPAPRILVVGDMAELGEQGRQCHEEVGDYAKSKGIDRLYSCGVLTQFAQLAFAGDKTFSDQSDIGNNGHKGFHFTEQSKLITTLIKEAKGGVTMLVKGSRSAHMENVVKVLTEYCNGSELSKEILEEESQSVASLQGDQ